MVYQRSRSEGHRLPPGSARADCAGAGSSTGSAGEGLGVCAIPKETWP